MRQSKLTLARPGLWAALLVCAAPLAANDDARPASSEELAFFEKRVRPLLVQHCYECHSRQQGKAHGGLQLDSHTRIRTGGDTGPAIIPGAPDRSLLLKAVQYDDENLQMPPDGKLSDADIATLAEWIRRGAPYPEEKNATPDGSNHTSIEDAKKHWAFQPLLSRPAPLPPASHAQWPRQRIDWFVLARQLEHDLTPSPSADRQTLLRRVKFDLLGLPPEPDEVTSFVHDPDPLAYEKLIDRFLASPQYGERWGRFWLDLTRYCDVPESWREGHAQAWLFRDWVVQAWNADVPYDQFVRKQLAADLLSDSQPSDLAALGFLGLSPTYWKELKLDHLVIRQVVAEEWEERIEAIGGTFLGLTIACARCHDHKFDPITVQDYYGLAGVLASSRLDESPLLADEAAATARQVRAKVTKLELQIKELLAGKMVSDENRKKAEELKQQVASLRQENPVIDEPWAFVVTEASLDVLPDGPHRTKLEYRDNEAQDVAIHIRGSASNPGPVVPRRFVSVLARDPQQRFQQGSGRRELADAIVRDAHPLAARVMVNRVWAHHFGRGLVTTPSNFGTQGDRPSHPELLDDLAARFIEHGWSLKWLHREILLSATFRQSASRTDIVTTAVSADGTSQPAVTEVDSSDPDNIWLARMPVKRLSVEAWRDSMLAVTGELDLRLGGDSQPLLDARNRRRTLYGTIKRREISDLLRLYDFPDPVSHSPERVATTTPLQQLFVLNSEFLQARSGQLAHRLRSEAGNSARDQLALAFRLLFGREATTDELDVAEDFVRAGEAAGDKNSLEQCLHVLLGSNEMMFVW